MFLDEVQWDRLEIVCDRHCCMCEAVLVSVCVCVLVLMSEAFKIDSKRQSAPKVNTKMMNKKRMMNMVNMIMMMMMIALPSVVLTIVPIVWSAIVPLVPSPPSLPYAPVQCAFLAINFKSPQCARHSQLPQQQQQQQQQ